MAIMPALFVRRQGSAELIPVASIDEAAERWNEYRERVGVETGENGASQIGNGVTIVDADGDAVAHVSYNGRIWLPGDPQFEEFAATSRTEAEINAELDTLPENPRTRAERERSDRLHDELRAVRSGESAPAKLPRGKARCSICGAVGSKAHLKTHEKKCKNGDCGHTAAEARIRALAKRDHDEDTPLPASEMVAGELLAGGEGLSSAEREAVVALGPGRAGRIYVESRNALTGAPRSSSEQGSLFDPPRRGSGVAAPSLKSGDVAGPATSKFVHVWAESAEMWTPLPVARLMGSITKAQAETIVGEIRKGTSKLFPGVPKTAKLRILPEAVKLDMYTGEEIQPSSVSSSPRAPVAAPAARTYNPDVHRKGDPTHINMVVLSEYFGPNDRVPNQIEATAAPHLRRCLKAGLVVPEGRTALVLTKAGQEALAAWRAHNPDWRESWERHQKRMGSL